MGIKLAATSGGSIELVPTNTASDFTVTVPAGTGTVAVNGVSSNIVSGTAVASTSGTSIDFTSIPSWVKRITVMFNGVSTNGTSFLQVQLGTGGSPTTSGYEVYSSVLGISAVTSSGFTTGFGIRMARTTGTCSGQLIFSNLSGNIWTAQYILVDRTNGESFVGGGAVTLSGVLNLARITTVNGTDTFDAGSINILYE